MAKTFDNTRVLNRPVTHIPALRSVWTLRLVVGIGIVLGGAISLTGTSWDIQWHSFVGRDRTLIPPHVMMLSGVTLAGLLALASVMLETLWVRRNAQLAQYSTDFAGIFYCSRGAYVTGFAALCAAIAFPLDSYWHALYGIDVAIWAPFHIMILTGMAVMPLGAAYMLASSARLAAKDDNQRAARISRFVIIVALGTMMGIMTLMLRDALDDERYIDLGSGFLNVFPLLAGLVTAYSFVTARYALSQRAAATYVMLAYLAFAFVFALFVPRATDALVVAEHLQYRRSLGQFAYLSAVSMQAWPLMPVIIAPLLDVCFALARRLNWSRAATLIALALLSLLSFFPVFALRPALGLDFIEQLGTIGLLLSLLLGLGGAYLGTLLGRYTGVIMSQEER
ncbi:MAG: hypothetical protein J2P37_31790 [Ktedonobacteraceae bacterium]|nr:hypothetical protein [Ktedonobacteraceae bacterium]MBO0790648.1 hypothetical protein [Ktedonobacteraceae bacterium]